MSGTVSGGIIDMGPLLHEIHVKLLEGKVLGDTNVRS